MGDIYTNGSHGLPIDQSKAFELYRRGSELGSANAHSSLACSYVYGEGVEVNNKKAVHHYQIAAVMGDELARHNLGIMEGKNGNHVRALKHFIIGAKCGNDKSLQEVKRGFMTGLVTKDDFDSTLRCHQASQDKRKSGKRERAKLAKRIQMIA